MTPSPTPGLPKKHPLWRKLWRAAVYLACLAIILALLAAGAVWYLYNQYLKPAPDQWSYTLNIGTYKIPVSVPATIRLATSPKIGPWLGWFHKNTRWGLLELGWDHDSQSLLITCSTCTVPELQDVGSNPIPLSNIQLRIRRENARTYSGTLRAGDKNHEITITWQATLQSHTLHIETNAKDISIASTFRALSPDLAELHRANITGTLSINATVTLPTFNVQISHIEVNNFTVSGLGTEQLINTTSDCGPPSNLPMNSWLVRAVISAEDQRFETHPGYDLQELMAAHQANQSSGSIVRGGSTITQQTAKILITGSQRTLTRKLRELLYAVEMEQTLGKARIMQLYLDNAPWGIYPNGRIVCGAQSAAQHYFQVDASKLRPEQAVWLAAMLHSPVGEARSWQRTGRINLQRALWIAEYVRNAPNSGPRGRQNVINALRRNPSLGMKPQPAPTAANNTSARQP